MELFYRRPRVAVADANLLRYSFGQQKCGNSDSGQVFGKATTQHHYIQMYTKLCVNMHQWLTENPISGLSAEKGFKRILLNQCQESFEQSAPLAILLFKSVGRGLLEQPRCEPSAAQASET